MEKTHSYWKVIVDLVIDGQRFQRNYLEGESTNDLDFSRFRFRVVANSTLFFPQRTDNSIKNHWNSSMKRKIEKYMSEKQKVPLQSIRLLPDGRFDYSMDEIDAVLAVVRLTSSSSSSSKKRSAHKTVSSASSKKKQQQSGSMGPPMHNGTQLATVALGYTTASSLNSNHPIQTFTTVATDGEMPAMGDYKMSPHPDMAISNVQLGLSPEITLDLTPLNNKAVGTFSNTFFSPYLQGAPLFSPQASFNRSTPLCTIAQDPFMNTPFGANPNDPFLQTPQLEPKRKLFASKSMNRAETYNNGGLFAEVAISPILDIRSVQSTAPRRNYFTLESLESPIHSLVHHHVSSHPMSQETPCLGIVPLKTSISTKLLALTKTTPVDIAIATPSVAGSACASALSSQNVSIPNSSTLSVVASQRHLFQESTGIDAQKQLLD